MSKTCCDIAIIGGGVSGLAAAWYLRRAGRDVCLLEKNDTVGGCTRTLQQDGFLLEQGPFNVLVRDPSFEELLSRLADHIEVVQADSSARIRYIYLKGRLVMVPTGPLSMVTTGLLSGGAKARVLAEPFCARKPQQADPTIGDFVSRHFGEQFAQTVVGAVVAGVYGGDVNRLSLQACFPTIAEIDRRHRSLVLYGLGLPFRKRAKPRRPRRKWRGMVSVVGGLGVMTSALGEQLGEGMRTGCEVTSIHQQNGGYNIRFQKDGQSQSLQADRLVLATEAQTAADLVSNLSVEPAGELAANLRGIYSVPLVVLNLGFRKADIGHNLRGFGFLVPPNQPDFPLMGVLWANSVFPHHAPAGHHLLRVFIGGSQNPQLASKNEDELVTLALSELQELLQIKGRPTMVNIARYPVAIPQYFQGHDQVTERIRTLQSSMPNFHLVGNYLEGVSLNDCVRLAKKTAGDILGTSA